MKSPVWYIISLWDEFYIIWSNNPWLNWYTRQALISDDFSRRSERDAYAKQLVYQINVPKWRPAHEFPGMPSRRTHECCTLSSRRPPRARFQLRVVVTHDDRIRQQGDHGRPYQQGAEGEQMFAQGLTRQQLWAPSAAWLECGLCAMDVHITEILLIARKNSR
jgi:hypothetical protein